MDASEEIVPAINVLMELLIGFQKKGIEITAKMVQELKEMVSIQIGGMA